MTLKLVPLLLAALVAAPSSALAQERPSLGVRLTTCTPALDVADRVAEFTAAMPSVPGASGLAVRFTLQQRDGDDWTRVKVPGWTRWEKAAPGAAGFVYAKRIERLDAPASYRAEVWFRWTDADGQVVRRAVRHSSSCRQPDLRPDLELGKLTVTPEGEGTARYTALVRNTGRGDASAPFAVALSVAGAEQPPQALPGLAHDGTGTVSWLAPTCAPGERVVVELDTADVVDEADEDDDVLSRRC